MIYRILNQVSNDFFDYIPGAVGQELDVIRSKEFNQPQFAPHHDVVSVIDFAGIVTGFVAITMSQETLDALVQPLFPGDSEEENNLKGEFLKEMTNGITGTTVEILRESHPLVTGLKPKLMKGFLSYPKVPCFSKMVETNIGEIGFSIAVDYMAMDINHFADRIKEVEKQLRESISQLEYRRDESEAHFRSKKEYLENHSRELGMPMGNLEGYSDMLLDQRIIHDQRESLDVMKNVSEGLISLIYGTFEFKKNKPVVQAIDELPFNLQHLIQEVVQGVQSQEIYSHRTIQLEAMFTDFEVIGDPLKIGEVLQSLVLNALQLSTREDEITIGMKETSSSDQFISLDFSVRVLPRSTSEKLDSIFDELCGEILYAGDGVISKSHLIHNSQSMVEAMGGNIGFKSDQVHGTSFSFSLTLRKDDQSNQTEILSSTLAKRQLLMVEPNALQADLFRRLMHRLGMNVVVVNKIESCISALQANVYDFVLFSDRLPSLDVLDYSREIRSHFGLDAPSILTVFSEEFRNLNKDIKSLPFSGILFKPLSYGSFKRVFQICLGIPSPDNIESSQNTSSELIARSQMKIQYFGHPEFADDSYTNSFRHLGLNIDFHQNFDNFEHEVRSDDKLLILDFIHSNELEEFKTASFKNMLREIEFYGVVVAVVSDKKIAQDLRANYPQFDDIILGDMGIEQIHALLRRMGY